VPLPAGSGWGAYRTAMERVVVPAIERFAPDLVVVASGLDAAGFDPLARMLLETHGVITIRQGQRGGPEIGSLEAEDLARTLSLFYRLSGASYSDVFSARILLEPVMARLAAEHQPSELIGELRALLEREKDSPAADYVEVSNQFQQLVSGLSGNPVLDLLGHALRALYAERAFSGGAFPEEELDFCREAHPQIGKAILAGQGARAERSMAEHLADLNRFVNERAAWFMNERVVWEA
jgi:GntR family transcriptional regulator, transcriptional repressor for pyruvate dehydrogenase complex